MGQNTLHLSTLLSPRSMWKFSRFLVFVIGEASLLQAGFGKSRQEQCFAAAERERVSTMSFARCMGRQGTHGSPVTTTQVTCHSFKPPYLTFGLKFVSNKPGHTINYSSLLAMVALIFPSPSKSMHISMKHRVIQGNFL